MENPGTWRPTAGIALAATFFVLLGMLMLSLPPRALAGSGAGGQVSVGISVRFGPPPLPVYAQPICPGPRYIWTPGYWAWNPDTGYYWVPGTWVLAPFVGALWTPGYWGWDPPVALFVWHGGYWGPRVGFYGGINYGFGYTGRGYEGGYWRGGDFYYNRSVNRINVVNITHVYNRTVIVRNVNRVSYNGGQGGIDARPSAQDRDAVRYRRMGPSNSQMNHQRMARNTPGMRWSQNRGRPDVAATPRPEMFRGEGISRATRSGGAYSPQQPMNRTQGQPQYHGQQGRQARPNGGQHGRGNQNRQQRPNNRGEGNRQGPPRN